MKMTDLYLFCLIDHLSPCAYLIGLVAFVTSIQYAWRNAVMLEMQSSRAGKIAVYYKQTFLPSF